jgi:hypothetical protein
MTGENAHLRLVLRTEACRTAALIRQLEEVSPGGFGEAGAVIRQAAAGDEVASDDLIAALASVRLTLSDTVTTLERIISSEPGRM